MHACIRVPGHRETVFTLMLSLSGVWGPISAGIQAYIQSRTPITSNRGHDIFFTPIVVSYPQIRPPVFQTRPDMEITPPKSLVRKTDLPNVGIPLKKLPILTCCRVHATYCCKSSTRFYLALLGLQQSRSGDRPVKFRVFSPKHGTAALTRFITPNFLSALKRFRTPNFLCAAACTPGTTDRRSVPYALGSSHPRVYRWNQNTLINNTPPSPDMSGLRKRIFM